MPIALTVGHSPDADDAFMFYGIAQGLVPTAPYEIVHVTEAIQSLNRRALRGDLAVTAISAAVYPRVADRYRILACGASVGRRYGPVLLSKDGAAGESLEGKRIAIPGEDTTAYLLLRIFASGFTAVAMDFDAVLPSLDRGAVDAALVIHEGQVGYKHLGYRNLMDLGARWFEETGLPIPLGLDVVRRDLGEEATQAAYRILRDSIRLARANEEQAIDYAMRFGRGMDRELCRTFVRMYVNDDTEQMGAEGRRALEALYRRAQASGLLERVPPLDILGLE